MEEAMDIGVDFTSPIILSSDNIQVNPHPNQPTTPVAGLNKRPMFDSPEREPRRTIFQKRAQRPTYSTSQDNLDNSLHYLIAATAVEEDMARKRKLLDFIAIFREFTEEGRVNYSSSILHANIQALESVARKIQTSQKGVVQTNSTPILNQGPKQLPKSYAQTAAANLPDWQQVQPKKARAKPAAPPQARKSRRLVITRPPNATELTPRHARDVINRALQNKLGLKGPFVAMVSKSFSGKTSVATTTEDYDANFLLQHAHIWREAFPFLQATKDEHWTKVAVHGIPIQEFNSEEGLETLQEDIRIFNKDLNPIGTPFWLTTEENRKTNRTGTIAVAFATEAEAKKALSSRLYVAGISCKTEKLLSVPPYQQCQSCMGFGHAESRCKRQIRCKFCAGLHTSADHTCPAQGCNSRGQQCKHLQPTCANCEGDHIADSCLCPSYRSTRKNNTSTQEGLC